MTEQQALERLGRERRDVADAIDEQADGEPVCEPALAALARALRDDERVVDAPTLAAVRAFLDTDSPLHTGPTATALAVVADLERRVYGIARPRAAAAAHLR